MKAGGIVLVTVCLLLTSFGVISAQQKKEQPPPMPPEMKEYMEKYVAPGEHHKHIEQMAGRWTTRTTATMVPGQPAQVSIGKADHKMVMGGRFLMTTYSGSFMGMLFHGMGTVGYDRYENKYVETWVDNFGTMTLVSEGQCSESGKKRTARAAFTDPMTQKKTYMKSVYTFTDANHYRLELFGPGPDGKEFKMMEIAHTRIPPPAPARK